MNILLTGSSGFLGINIKKFLEEEYPEYNIIEFDERLNIKQEDLIKKYNDITINIIIHMASPTCSEDFKKLTYDEIYYDIINGTDKFIKLAEHNNAELIYFSSEAIYQLDNIYAEAKSITNIRIINSNIKYKILIIPRVYCSSRKKGLIKKLKDNLIPESDMNQMIEYLDIKDFIKQFKMIFSDKDQKIFRFHNKVQGTIKDIKLRYLG